MGFLIQSWNAAAAAAAVASWHSILPVVVNFKYKLNQQKVPECRVYDPTNNPGYHNKEWNVDSRWKWRRALSITP